MQVSKIFYTSQFRRSYKKLLPETKMALQIKESVFRNNCFDHSLKTHKLSGRFSGFWSFSVNYSYRVVFVFQDNAEVDFVDIGNHSIYK